MIRNIPTDEETAARERQVRDWKRIVDAGEVLTLVEPAGTQLRIYSAHPHGGYTRLRITPMSDGPPDVGQHRIGPDALADGWLSPDWGDGYRERDPNAQ